MKIFNIENGKEKVYVQKEEIDILSQVDIEMPLSIIFGEYDEKSDPKSFIEFSSPAEVNFFKKADWIMDYKSMRDMSYSELLDVLQQTIIEINSLMTKVPTAKENGLKDHPSAYNQYKLLWTKKNNLLSFMAYKSQKNEYMNNPIKINFPVVPDSEPEIFNDEDTEYVIQSSVEQNKILVFRKDGESISKKSLLPYRTINEALTDMVVNMELDNDENDYVYQSTDLSHDKKYLIIGINTAIYKQKTSKGKTFFKKIFSKNKKYQI